VRGRENIRAFFATFPVQSARQFIHSHVVDVQGDRGTGFSYLDGRPVRDGKSYYVVGRFDDEYIRLDGQWMFQRVVFGPVTHSENENLKDLTWRERLVFAPLLILIFWMGVAPQPFIDRTEPALTRTLALMRARAVASGRMSAVNEILPDVQPVIPPPPAGEGSR